MTSDAFAFGGYATNYFPNSSMSGAVVGTPGTMPTGIIIFNNSTGFTSSVVGTGTDANGYPYIDVSFAGTSTGANVCGFTVGNTGTMPACQGQTWTFTNWMQLVGGSFPAGLVTWDGYNEWNSGLTSAGGGSTPTVANPVSSNATKYVLTRTNSAATCAFVGLTLKFNLFFSSSFAFTIRLSGIQCEISGTSTPFISTSGAAASAVLTDPAIAASIGTASGSSTATAQATPAYQGLATGSAGATATNVSQDIGVGNATGSASVLATDTSQAISTATATGSAGVTATSASLATTSSFPWARASTGSYLDATGQMQIAPNNTMRVDHSPASPFAVTGVLAERASRNLYPFGNTLGRSAWVSSGTDNSSGSSTDITGIYAAANVIKHARNTVNVDNNVGSVNITGLASGNQVTGSLWVYIPTNANITSARISLEGGTVTVPSVAANLTLRDQWQRLSATAIMSGTSTNIVPRLTATTGDFIYTTCWQLEYGGTVTSYIPTSGSTASRAFDISDATAVSLLQVQAVASPSAPRPVANASLREGTRVQAAATLPRPIGLETLARGETIGEASIVPRPVAAATVQRGEFLSAAASVARPKGKVSAAHGQRISVLPPALLRPFGAVVGKRGEAMALSGFVAGPRASAGITRLVGSQTSRVRFDAETRKVRFPVEVRHIRV